MATQSPRTWSRVKWTRAGQVIPLMAGDHGTLDADLSPADAFARSRAEDPLAAVRLAAQALPRIDAARWMLACLEQDGRPADPARATALKAVRRWVDHPSDEARKLAWQAGEAIGFDGAAGAGCLAIFLSGGSLSPEPQEVPVNPAPGLFGQAVAGAVALAAYADGAPVFAERVAAMLDRADAIASDPDA